jgi:hypothetical protein
MLTSPKTNPKISSLRSRREDLLEKLIDTALLLCRLTDDSSETKRQRLLKQSIALEKEVREVTGMLSNLDSSWKPGGLREWCGLDPKIVPLQSELASADPFTGLFFEEPQEQPRSRKQQLLEPARQSKTDPNNSRTIYKNLIQELKRLLVQSKGEPLNISLLGPLVFFYYYYYYYYYYYCKTNSIFVAPRIHQKNRSSKFEILSSRCRKRRHRFIVPIPVWWFD